MANQPTMDLLKAMRMSAMAQEFERQITESAYTQLVFEERFALLVDAEWHRRQQNRLIRSIRSARFATPNAAVEEIEYHEDRHLDKAQILRFATCKYIDEGRHHPQRCLREWQDLPRLRSGERRLPQIFDCSLHPFAGTVGGSQSGTGRWQLQDRDPFLPEGGSSHSGRMADTLPDTPGIL